MKFLTSYLSPAVAIVSAGLLRFRNLGGRLVVFGIVTFEDCDRRSGSGRRRISYGQGSTRRCDLDIVDKSQIITSQAGKEVHLELDDDTRIQKG